MNKYKSKDFDKILKTLPKFKIIHKKPDTYLTSHIFKYTYLVERKNSTQELVLIEKEKNRYTGGTIEEGPLFPGCKRSNEITLKKCFQAKMREHIATNFNYPKAAEKKGIQGKVFVMFTIDKKGATTKIRLRGPDKILEDNDARIVGLLPKFGPGLQNGKLTSYPISIPITYKFR